MSQGLHAWLLTVAGETDLADDDLRRIANWLADGGGTVFDAARLVGIAGTPPAAFDRAMTPPDDEAISLSTALVMASFALVRIRFDARNDAVHARSRMASLADRTYAGIDADAPRALDFCMAIAGTALDHVSAEAATLAPVLRVETGMRLPSSLLAFDLYGDAARGDELVGRNGHHAPLLMPTDFEALAS